MPILKVMAGPSFFIRSPEAAQRHVTQLLKILRSVAVGAIVGGAGCGIMALLLGYLMAAPSTQSNAVQGPQLLSGISFIAWFIAAAMLLFSGLYFVAGWGLSHRKPWARYTAAAIFLAKLLLCVWLGRTSVGTMIVFLSVAGLDVYGLWVLLSKETEQFLSSPKTTQANIKPANLVT
jgi:hypothetical protein